MKRFFLLITLAAGFLQNVRAEITIGASVDMAIIPFQLILNNDTAPKYFGAPEQVDVVVGAGAGRYGSSQGIRGRLDTRASYEDIIGMRLRIQARTDGIGIEDYLQAWWKPLSWLRVDAGRFFDDRLRGKINDLDERMNGNNVRMYDGDAIFSRFRTHRYGGQAGIMLSAVPIENLFLGVLLYDLLPFAASSSSLTSAAMYDAHPDYVTDNADVYRRIQAAAAWAFPNIGLARIQYLGAKPLVQITRVSDEVLDDNGQLFFSYMFDTFSIIAPRIEAAFAFTGISGLTIDIGGKIPLPFKNWDQGPPDDIFEKEDEELLDVIYRSYKKGFIWQAPYQASLGVRFTPAALESLELAGRIDAKFLGYMKGYRDEMYFAPEINIHIWPSWNFNIARLIFDFGMEYIGPTYDKEKKLIGGGTPAALNGGYRLGAGISLQKTIITNCLVKGGIAYKFAGTVNGVREKAVLTIPLYLEYSF